MVTTGVEVTDALVSPVERKSEAVVSDEVKEAREPAPGPIPVGRGASPNPLDVDSKPNDETLMNNSIDVSTVLLSHKSFANNPQN